MRHAHILVSLRPNRGFSLRALNLTGPYARKTRGYALFLTYTLGRLDLIVNKNKTDFTALDTFNEKMNCNIQSYISCYVFVKMDVTCEIHCKDFCSGLILSKVGMLKLSCNLKQRDARHCLRYRDECTEPQNWFEMPSLYLSCHCSLCLWNLGQFIKLLCVRHPGISTLINKPSIFEHPVLLTVACKHYSELWEQQEMLIN